MCLLNCIFINTKYLHFKIDHLWVDPTDDDDDDDDNNNNNNNTNNNNR